MKRTEKRTEAPSQNPKAPSGVTSLKEQFVSQTGKRPERRLKKQEDKASDLHSRIEALEAEIHAMHVKRASLRLCLTSPWNSIHSSLTLPPVPRRFFSFLASSFRGLSAT